MQNKDLVIFYPMCALAILTFLVGIKGFFDRIRELMANRLSPQKLATATSIAQTLKNVQATDNFRNSFEVPTLFYALAISLFVTNKVDAFFLMGSWLFVGLRYLQTLIHLSYNRVRHRATVFILGTLVLLGLWIRFAVLLGA